MLKISVSLLVSLLFSAAMHAQKTGIGTTAPLMPLHVSVPTDTAILLLENRTALSTNSNLGLYFKNGDYYTGAIKTLGTATNGSRLSLFTFADGSQNTLRERLSITDNGNVGIGTALPTAALDVNGTVRLRSLAAAGKVLTSDAIGNATWQTPAGSSSVAFNAELNGDVTVPINVNYRPTSFSENFEEGGNNFNTSTGLFTAPVAGVYHFVVNVGWGATTGGSTKYYLTRILLTRAGLTSFISQTGQPVTAIAGYGTGFSSSVIYKLEAGDTVGFEVLHTFGAATLGLSGNGSTATTFSGAKIN